MVYWSVPPPEGFFRIEKATSCVAPAEKQARHRDEVNTAALGVSELRRP